MKKPLLVLIPFLLLAGCAKPADKPVNSSTVSSSSITSSSDVSSSSEVTSSSNIQSSSEVKSSSTPSSSSEAKSSSKASSSSSQVPTNEPAKGALNISVDNSHSFVIGTGTPIKSNHFSFSYDLKAIFDSPEKYNANLAKLGLLLSAEQYDFFDVNTYETKDAAQASSKNEIMKQLNLKDITSYPVKENEYQIDPKDTVAFDISHAEYDVAGSKSNLVVISFSGTSSDDEWDSNLDLGSTVKEYMQNASEHPDWTNTKHHKGMDVAKNRAAAKIEAYVKDKIKNTNPTTYFVTGHSRGAGVANLFGKDLIEANKKAVVYGFNGPNVVEKDAVEKLYKSIFNCENRDDLLSTIPSETSGFTKYGQKLSIDFEGKNGENKTFAEDFEAKIGYAYKSLSAENLASVATTISALIKDRDSLYSFNAEPLSADNVTVTGLENVETKKAQILAVAKKYNCDSKILFNETEDLGNGKYKLTWRISNSMFLEIMKLFLTGQIKFDMSNPFAMLSIVGEFNTFAPGLTTSLYPLITTMMSDMTKVAVPHSPESLLIGVDHIAK